MGTQKRERQKAGRQARIEAAREAQRKAENRRRITMLIGIAVFVAAAVGLLAFLTRDKGSKTASDATTTSSTDTTVAGAVEIPPAPAAGESITGPTPCPATDGSSPRTTSFAQAPPMCIDPAKTYTATFDTTAGTIEVKLDAANMPSTTNNFVVLSLYHYYDGTAIFRTDPSIDILQGGAATSNSPSDPGPGYTIPDEGGTFDFSSGSGTGPFKYQAGQLVMARTSGPNSSGAQFFMTTGPNASNLDSQGTYLLFGQLTQGLDVAQQIVASGVQNPALNGLGDSPVPPVVVNTVTITES